MKKFLKIFIIFAVFGVIGLAVYFIKKRKQDEKDRDILNGMTSDEFLDSIRPAWKNKFISAQVSWLKDQPEYTINTIQMEQKINYDEAKKFRDETTLGSATASWNELKPNPNDFDWARIYWLPTEIDNMGLNINHERVKELISKI
jgi:hypothetical protein